MDKYEYQLKLDQLKKLVNEGDYATAGEIVDSINWKKVRNSTTLCMAGDVYDQLGRYEESKEAYLLAYDYAPIGRNIIYKLTEVAIKSNSLAEAEEYYNEYAEIASNDTQKMVLRYKLSTLKNEPVQNRISILEELKEREYTEEWAYELAQLYHQVGRTQECVDVCDELDLWFGEGEYVAKALALKANYAALTPMQENKVEAYRQNREAKITAVPVVAEDTTSSIPEETIDLQAALQDSLREMMGDKTVAAPVVEAPVVEVPVMEVPEVEEPVMETPVVEEVALVEQEEVEAPTPDGFVEPDKDEEAWLNDQITGQINIEDVLAEWEKTKSATEAVLAETEEPVVEEPVAEEIVAEEPVAEEPTDEDIDAMLVMPDITNFFAEEPVAEEPVEETPVVEETVAEEPAEAPADEDIDAQLVMPDITGMMEEAEEEPVIETTPEPEVQMPVWEAPTVELPKTEVPVWEAPKVELPNLVVDPETLFAEPTAKTVDEIPLPEDLMEDIAKKETFTGDVVLTKEQRALFPYFLPVPGMEPQICQVLKDCLAKKKTITSMAGNITIEGPDGSGKTVLAASLVKALQMMTPAADGRIGKISAIALNKKDFETLIPRLEGGYLIIEKAGNLLPETVEKISRAMEGNTQGLTVIMEDSKSRIRAVLAQNLGFAQKFTSNITIPVFTIDELVEFGKSYAKEMECIIDEMGILALYNRISNIQKHDKATTLTEVREIVDQAIESAESGGGIKKTFGSFLSKRYNENDFLILHEKDFDF